MIYEEDIHVVGDWPPIISIGYTVVYSEYSGKYVAIAGSHVRWFIDYGEAYRWLAGRIRADGVNNNN